MPVEHPSQRFKSHIPAVHWIDFLTFGFIVAFMLIQLAFYQRTEAFEPDSSFYIGLAGSILQHGSYAFNFKPHIIYPPGFPAILAILSLLFGATYKVFILSMPVFGAGGLIIAYYLLREMEGRTVACAGCLLLASAPYFFSMTTEIINADLPFLLASMSTLFLAVKLDRASVEQKTQFLWSGLVFSLMASLLIRTVGIALLLGLGAWLFISWWTGQRSVQQIVKYAPAVVASMVTEAFWLRWTWKIKHMLPQEEAADYFSSLVLKDPHRPESGNATPGDLLLRVGHNLINQSAHLVELLSRKSWVDPLWYSPLIVGCIILVIIGLAISMRHQGGSYPEWYFLFYAAIYLLWPFDVGPRFLLPAFPLAFLYLWRGSAWLVRRSSEKPRVIAPYGIVLSTILFAAGLASLYKTTGTASAQAKLNVVLAACSAVGFSAVCSTRVVLMWGRIRRGVKEMFGTRRNLQQALGTVVLATFVAGGLTVQLAMAQQNLSTNLEGDIHRPSSEAALWLSRNTRKGTIMAGEEAIVHRISGRKVAVFPVTSAPDRLLKAIDNQGATFIIVVCERASNMFPTEPERLKVPTNTHPHLLRLVQQGPCYQIFEIVGAALANP